MVSLGDIKALIGEVLQVTDRLQNMGEDAVSLGITPEFDSMSVVSVKH